MATLTSEDKLNPRLAVLVNDDTSTAVALIDRDSIEYSFNEEDGDFEPHSSTRVLSDPTTEDPEISFDAARAVDDDALAELGVRDDADQGKYVRDAGREWDVAELWYFKNDADVESDEPDKIDRFEDVRWNIDSSGPDGNALTFSAEADVEGDIYLDYEETTS